MAGRYRWTKLVFAGVLAGIIAAASVSFSSPVEASHPTIWDYRVHWDFASWNWHWGPAAEDHHLDFGNAVYGAGIQWVNACCPDSPWHAHYDTSSENHIDTIYYSPRSAPARAGTFYDGNAAFHMNWASLEFNHNFFDNDSEWLDDTMYGDTGTPTWYQVDGWSAAAEEFGHVQNINHFGTGSCRTMSGQTDYGQTCKRNLSQAERNAAWEPYDLMHP